MKKIIAGLLTLCCAVSVNAAQVNFEDSQSSVRYMNHTNDFKFNSDDYQAREIDYALVAPQANNGEELIYLGAYQNIGYDSAGGENTISVDLQNINQDQTNTGGVSLVLSGGQQMTWDLTWDTTVALNSIILFGLVGEKDMPRQSLIINGSAVDLTNLSNNELGLNIIHSSQQVCGFALPQNSDQCRTDRIVGINRNIEDEFGDSVSSNDPIINYLGEETGLKITSFNGAYEANNFVIGIDTTAVPLPSALFLFSSSLYLVFAGKRIRRNQL